METSLIVFLQISKSEQLDSVESKSTAAVKVECLYDDPSMQFYHASTSRTFAREEGAMKSSPPLPQQHITSVIVDGHHHHRHTPISVTSG
jgi:hypothetical protein